MKYLRLFPNDADYQQFISGGGGDFVLPNVSYVEGDNTLHYHPVPPPGAGAIVYKSGSDLLTVDYTLWDASMGTPVGVIVIPKGFAPDGKARMLSLQWASSSRTSSTSATTMTWELTGTGTDTSLTNHTKVPTTDNAGSTTTGSDNNGFLPSDKFSTGATSYVDSTAKYNSANRMIPSPYLVDKPNPAYYAAISGYNNALADFDGKGNTDVLVALGADYVAANAARNYKAAGAEEIEWYLPSMGELGYMMARFQKIQAALATVRAPLLEHSNYYWSSSESSSYNAYRVFTGNGSVSTNSKNGGNHYVRPFALLA